MCMHKLSGFHINFSNASAGQGLNTVFAKLRVTVIIVTGREAGGQEER